MKKEIISTDKAPAAIGPYVQATKLGEMLFTSGVIPVNPATGEIPSTVDEQARQAFSSLKALVEASGSSIEKVVKTTLFIKNMDDFAKINAIYAEVFAEPYPCRSCVEVARLPNDVLLEIEAVAHL